MAGEILQLTKQHDGYCVVLGGEDVETLKDCSTRLNRVVSALDDSPEDKALPDWLQRKKSQRSGRKVL